MPTNPDLPEKGRPADRLDDIADLRPVRHPAWPEPRPTPPPRTVPLATAVAVVAVAVVAAGLLGLVAGRGGR